MRIVPKDLSARLTSCIENWCLQNLSQLQGGFSSHVFGCTTADGDDVVLKLPPTPDAAQREVAALRVWADTGASVRLLDANLEQSALLLDRIRPATPLPSSDDPGAIEVATYLLPRLLEVSAGSFPFPALGQLWPEWERVAREDAAYEQRTRGEPMRGLPGLQRLDAARAITMSLCATTERAVLLHGDFLDKNLLWNGRGYVAIDPIPRIGDPCSDIGLFAACHPPVAGILARATAIATRIGLNPHRTRQWAAVGTVLQTAQAWRPDQAELEACVASDAFERLLAD